MRRRLALTEHEAVTVLRLVAGMGVLLFVAFTFADSDLWGHVRFGEDILDHRSLASHDPYSFASDRPWVNHEWLSEIVMALAYRVAGATGLVALKILVVLATLVLVSRSLRRVTWRPVDHDALIALTVIAMFQRSYPLRPQVFSLLLFAALLHALTQADRGNKRLLALAPVVMLLWTNLHGAWMVGLGVLGVWVLVRLFWRNPGAVERRWVLLTGLGSIVATLANPYGLGLWSFMRDTVGLSRPGIADWLPLLSVPPVYIVLAAFVAGVAVVAVAKARRGADPAYVLIVIALAVGTLRINRIDAFFALAVVMLLGPYLGRRRAPAPMPARDGTPLWRRPVAVVVLAAAVITFSIAATAGANVTCISLRDEPEPESLSFLQHHAPRAKVLIYFDWGEYAIWHLGPGLKVSMDGRRETVYSDALFQAHVRLYHGERGGTALVGRLNPDLIWLPVDLPVIDQLKREGWKPAFVGPVSVILERRLGRPLVRVRRMTAVRRCFPDA